MIIVESSTSSVQQATVFTFWRRNSSRTKPKQVFTPEGAAVSGLEVIFNRALSFKNPGEI